VARSAAGGRYGIAREEVDASAGDRLRDRGKRSRARYVVYPGQACSYMIGQLKYLELREKSRMALGPKFSLREYHNVVLTTGNVPLNVMERIVDGYISRSKA
jgi:uncharacterized protein (DUF885 family)